MEINRIFFKVVRGNGVFPALIIILALCLPAKAQVNINVNIFPPYSPYYADYSGANASKVLLTVQNTSASTLKIKLTGKLTGNNGITISTRLNYIPLQPIILNPHELKQLSGNALKDIFDLSNMNVVGIDKAKLALTSRIPEGNYSFCIQAVDYGSRQVLSASAPQGCTMLNIVYPDPPILLNPIPMGVANATNPQNLIFNWAPPGSVPANTQYTIEIAEMPGVAANPAQVLNAASFPVLSATVTGFSYSYNALSPALVPGKRYAWRVVAKDPMNRVLFKNNGASEAGQFTYTPVAINPPYKVLVLRAKQGTIEVSGTLNFQYHETPDLKMPGSFTGITTEIQPLANEPLQLCYGVCKVKLNLQPHQVTQIVGNNTLTDKKRAELAANNVQIAPYKADSSSITYSKTDSIPTYGVPVNHSGIDIAGNFEGGLGEVIANTTTTPAGTFAFSTLPKQTCGIIEVEADNTAYINCYYINIKNKHYTDPQAFIYIPASPGNSSVNIGVNNVHVNNYNLAVRVNRDAEHTAVGKDHKISTENNPDDKVDIYILRKQTLVYNRDYTAPYVPKSEGDNTGRLKLIPKADTLQAFLMNAGYEVVATRSVQTGLSQGAAAGQNSYGATAYFYDLVDNLDASETYTVYAEYKKSKVYFDQNDYSFQPLDDIPEYNPQPYGNSIPNKQLAIQPSYISITVKGVLKYQFKNGIAEPLANTSISLRSMFWYHQTLGDGKTAKIIDYINANGFNRTFDTETTGNNGEFELHSGFINYNDYAVANNLFQGISQYIIVNSPYYGSPDKEYLFEGGNTYNLGELTAMVKQYSLSAQIKQKGTSNTLAGQRVYLMRLASVNPQQWGIPADEGIQHNLPVKQLNDKNGTLFNVIGYGITDKNGLYVFDNLVAPDWGNNDDRYYLYSESGITSLTNYSTNYGLDARITNTQHSKYFLDYYNGMGFMMNAEILGEKYSPAIASFGAEALAPYIEGGIYPFSNESTKALPGVKVDLYDVKFDPVRLNKNFTKDNFDAEVKTLGIDKTLTQAGPGLAYSNLSFEGTITTDVSCRFRFDDVTSNNNYSGWKVLIFSKAGFITNYLVINGGQPMLAGTKETVKGFLLPPRKVHVTVKDDATKEPVAATIVVGNDFSWGAQDVASHYDVQSGKQITLVSYTDPVSPYGSDIAFKVVPDDNIKYQGKAFYVNIPQPDNLLKPNETGPVNLNFTLKARNYTNNISVCLYDAVTKKSIAGTVALSGIPDIVNPAKSAIFILQGACKTISFTDGNISSYYLTARSPGYADDNELIQANFSDDGMVKDVSIYLQPTITIKGIVTLDGQPVKDARVYVNQFGNIDEALTMADGSYTLSGLPENNLQVTISAVKTSTNAPGQNKVITLAAPGANNTPAPGGALGGNVNLNQNNGGLYVPKPGKTGQGDSQTVNFALTSNNDINLSNLYGFALEVEDLKYDGPDVASLTGRILIRDNNSFGLVQSHYLHVSNVQIHRGTKNSTLKPYATNVVADDDNLPVTVFGKYQGTLEGFASGIFINSGGVIGSTVVMSSNGIATNVKLTSEVSLEPQYSKPGNMTADFDNYVGAVNFHATDYKFNVFKALASNVTIAQYFTFQCSNGIGTPYEGLHYNLNNTFYTSAKGYLATDGFHLFSTLHTNLQNVATPDIALNVGEIWVDNMVMHPVNGKTPLNIPLDDWNVTSSDWTIASGRLKFNGSIRAGAITVPFSGMELSPLSFGFGVISLDQVMLAGAIPVKFDQKNTTTSFGYDKAAQYGTQYNEKYGCWSLSLLPNDPNGTLTSLTGLADMAQGDAIGIMNISLYSKGGESRIILDPTQKHVTLNNMADFEPTELENGQDYLKINGALTFNIPGFTGTENRPYSLNYGNSGGQLVHQHVPIDGLKLTTNGIHVDFGTAGQTFTGDQFALTGTLKDKVTNSPYAFTVNFTKNGDVPTGDGTKIVIDPNDKSVIPLGGGQQMSNFSGSMTMNDPATAWNNFKFEGDVGALGMTKDKPTHIQFEVKGDLVASKAHIGVENMPMPDNMGAFSITYDFEKKAIIGSLHLEKVATPMGKATSDIEMMFGGGHWYILGAAVLEEVAMPLPVNGASSAFLIGNSDVTTDMLQIIAPVFHNGQLPDNFSQKFSQVKGSLLVAGIDMKLPFMPNIDFNVAVAQLHINYGVYANAFMGLTFADGISDVSVIGGLKVGAYVNISAGLSLGLACSGVALSAEANIEGDITMDHLDFTQLNPAAFLTQSQVSVTLKPTITLSGEAYLGYGICDSDCNSVTVWGVTIPPGCHKTDIGGDLTLSLTLDLLKPIGKLTPSQADISAIVLGTKLNGHLSLPGL